MAKPVRRVVTGHDANGKAIVISDAPAPFVHLFLNSCKNVRMSPKEEPRGTAEDAPPTVRAAVQLWAEIERARRERDAADALVQRLEGTLELLLDGLPAAERDEYRRLVDEVRAGAGAAKSRGGEVYGNVIELFRQTGRREWTIPEIQSALNEIGKEADLKAIYNTINYFAKTGRLQRISRGQYLVRGIGGILPIEGVADDGTVRESEND
jgi:hypothetical protein